MKLVLSSTAMTALLFSLSVQAHDPSMHKGDAEQPDCTAMQGIDTSKMDANDPVLLAMMKKCAKRQHKSATADSEQDAHH